MRRRIHRIATFAALLSITGCTDSFFTITDPDELQASAIDPEADGPALARSAFQNLADAYGNVALYVAWWAYEARVGDTFPTRNEFGRRFIDDTNGTLNTEGWSPLVLAASTGEQSVGILQEVGGLPLAIAAFTEGYALVLMAETFCEGTVAADPSTPGPRMSTQELLDLAVERLTTANTQGKASGTDEGDQLATAAMVGIARAQLQAGNKSAAAAAAAQVPADFEFDLKYVDDAANRGRLGNNLWNFTTARTSLVVPPEYIAMADAGDPRISYEDAGKLAQDSELEFIKQQKFTGYGSPIRLASGLEARYIAAEASGSMTDQLALINERRAVGNQGDFSSSDPAAVFSELMEQRVRDFWLEGKKMGDYRRNGDAVPYFLPDNSEYYKSGVGNVGTQKCWPVPDVEKRTNPNFS